MKHIRIAALGVAGLLAASASAHAAVLFSGYQTALNAGETLVTNFDSASNLADLAFGSSGYNLTGSAVLYTGSLKGLTAAPTTGVGMVDRTQYLSVHAGQSATLETPLLESISFYVGSLDAYNSFTFNLASGVSQTFTGAAIAALGVAKNANLTSSMTNGRLTFSFGDAIESVVLRSSGNSLEVSDIGAITSRSFALISAIPEPQTWALMIGGFGAVGALVRRKRKAVALA